MDESNPICRKPWYIFVANSICASPSILKQSCLKTRASNLNTVSESYCLPVLTYAMAALNLTVKQKKELNACWNSVYRKLFGFHKWQSVKCCINGLNRLDLHSIIKLRRVSFYRHMVFSDSRLLSDVFWCFFVDFQPSTDVLAVLRRPVMGNCHFCN